MKKITLVLAISLALFSSCYYDKEDLLYGTTTCNSTGSTFSATVLPIMNTRCNACHSSNAAASSGGGIVLDNYNSVKTYVTNGKLLGSINHSPGYSPMPKGATKLSSCDIAKINDWVNSGAPNN